MGDIAIIDIKIYPRNVALGSNVTTMKLLLRLELVNETLDQLHIFQALK